jgi:hypothetical protein
LIFFDSDVGNYDRVVIQDLLKEVAQTQQVDAAAQKRFKGAFLTYVRSFRSGITYLASANPLTYQHFVILFHTNSGGDS